MTGRTRGRRPPAPAGALTGLAQAFADGRTTPRDHVRGCLERIEASRLNAFLSLDPDGALEAAEASSDRWAAGAPLSPLDGASFGIKANIAVRGWPWHGGVAAYADRRAEADAEVVRRLRAAGGVLLGGLNMDEGALGARGDNPAFGRCGNPFGAELAAGGSSSGAAAAVGGGLCAAALGTDSLGSVRIPASFCGVTGHLPSRGVLSVVGVMPLSFTLDAVGLLAQGPADAAVVLKALGSGPVGLSRGDPRARRRCGLLREVGGRGPDEPTRSALEACAARAAEMGLSVEPVSLPSLEPRALARALLFIVEAEAALEHEAVLRARPEGFGAEFKGMLAWAGRQPAPRLAEAYRTLASAAGQLRSALQPYELLLSPTTPFPAWRLSSGEPPGVADFTILANVAGLAATAFPVEGPPGASPLSAQLMGWSDHRTLGVAAGLTRPTPPGAHP